MSPNEVLEAMKATAIPPGESGLWRVTTQEIPPFAVLAAKSMHNRDVEPGTQKGLHRYTDSTLYTGGEIVMEDSLHERRQHLSFALNARGRVLVTGLGLGCVVRGLLCNPRVESIDVAEISEDVLSLVAGHMPKDPRLKIHHVDAFEFVKSRGPWDFAWHDIWTDTDSGEPHLQVAHMQLFLNCMRRAKRQGAWAMPRHHLRALREAGLGIVR